MHTDPPAPSRGSNLKRALQVVGAIFVCVFAFWQFSDALHKSTFHPDESRWINRGIYLQELRNPLSSFWADSYLIRGQPPMGS